MKPWLIGGIACILLGTSCTALDTTVNKLQTVKDTVTSRKNHHTVIVPGYGAPVEGSKTYEGYIKEVAKYVKDESNAVNSVVFTGGFSNLPELSEAEAMNNYFNSRVDVADLQQRGIRVYKEECAIVSWQNISNSQELLAADGIQPTKVTLFGDTNRQEKLTTFAAYKFNLAEGLPQNAQELLNASLHVASVNFIGYNFGDEAKSELDRNAIFAAEAAGAYDAMLGNEVLAERLQQWSDEFGYDVIKNLVDHGCTEYQGFKLVRL